MSDTQNGDPNELIDAGEASRLLDVTPERIQAMVGEGMLTPTGDGDDLRFSRGEVIAARMQGG